MALTQREGTRYLVLLVIGNAAVHERCPFQRLRGVGIKDNNYKNTVSLLVSSTALVVSPLLIQQVSS